MIRRILTTIYIPAILLVVWQGGYLFLALIDGLILVGMLELYRMMQNRGIRPYKTIGIASGLALSWYVFFRSGLYSNLFLTLTLLIIMTLELTRRENQNALYHISATIFGVFYVSWLGSHFVMLREMPRDLGIDYSEGTKYVVLVFLIAWFCDTGAFFVGRWLGKRQLLPRVSPKKSVEGALGGIGTATMVSAICSLTFASNFLPLGHSIILGVSGGIMAILGDLVESLIKRDTGIKDSSQALPGHGGVLDRFDSTLFVAPLVYYYLRFILF